MVPLDAASTKPLRGLLAALVSLYVSAAQDRPVLGNNLPDTLAASLFARNQPFDSRQWPLLDSSSYFDPYSDRAASERNAKMGSRVRGRLAGGRLHFASFALPGYEESMNELCHEAELSGLFIETHCFAQIPEEAMEGRWNALRRKKDVKVEWLYLPAMTQYLLRRVIPPGDSLMFAEATVDMSFNESNWMSLLSLMAGSREQRANLIAFQRSDSPEYLHTKGDVFKEFGVQMDDVEVTSYQLTANYFIVENIRPVHLFLTSWANALSEPHLLTDHPSHAPNNKDFVESFHEASLWSMMIKANRPRSNCRPLHRVKNLKVHILPYSGCDDLRQVPIVPVQARCLRHRKCLKERIRKSYSTPTDAISEDLKAPLSLKR
mmetsp:Transcript_11864/g.32447  ORF Transcript_11864/g.32447 Transcript_11864/m.32447 type:complete len:377 (-) Transcript_11864:52-1182(-)